MRIEYQKGSTGILAAGCYLPSQRIKTEDLLAEIYPEALGMQANYIESTMGIFEVRHSNMKPSQLAAQSVRLALADCSINSNDIDLIIFCGIEGDCVEPATAHHVKKLVGLDCPLAFDIKNACMGFTTALQIADGLIAAGTVRYAIVCTGERNSRVTKDVIRKYKQSVTFDQLKNSIGAFTLGDAGGAAIIGPSLNKQGFITFGSSSDSRYTDLCYYSRQGLQINGKMDMGKICAVTLSAHEKVYNETMTCTGWRADDIDCLITHQVGERAYKKLSKIFNVPEVKMTRTYPDFGNVTTASLPLNWMVAKAENRLKRDSKIWIATSGSGIGVSHIGVIVP